MTNEAQINLSTPFLREMEVELFSYHKSVSNILNRARRAYEKEREYTFLDKQYELFEEGQLT